MTIALELLRRFWPYLVAGAIGFIAAWGLQGLRLTASEQDFTQYKQDQAEAILAEATAANKQREEAANEYRKVAAKLKDEINAGAVMRRCIAAGKCGVPVQPTCASATVLTADGTHAPGPNTVSIAAGTATVVDDCAITTLMLNMLQADIEK